MADNTIQWDKDADGIVTLTLDDPNGSANVMNENYRESMHKTVERLVAEKDSITGVVITSAKKTFFAGGDLNTIIQAGPENAGEFFAEVEGIKRDLRALETLGKPVVAAINGAALGGGLEICAGVSSPHHRRRIGCGRRLPRGDARPASRCRWRHPQCADVRHPERVHERAVPGHQVQARAGQGDRPGRRVGRLGRGIGAGRQGVDQGQPRRAHPAVGPEGLQDARRHPGQPRAGRHPAVVPGAAEEAAQGRADACAAGDPGCRGRGRAGGLRHRQPHREPLLHVSGHRSGRQEHDPGVLLRPAAPSPAAARGPRASARPRSRRSVCSAPG